MTEPYYVPTILKNRLRSGERPQMRRLIQIVAPYHPTSDSAHEDQLGTKPKGRTIAAGRLTWRAPVIGSLLRTVAWFPSSHGAERDQTRNRSFKTAGLSVLGVSVPKLRPSFDQGATYEKDSGLLLHEEC